MQRVDINNKFSNDFNLNCGVLQGSFMGPVLFILYVSRLYHVNANHLPSAHGYADDTNSIFCLDQTAFVLRSCSKGCGSLYFRHRMSVLRLLINDATTKFLIVGSIDSIIVGDSTIQPLESVRNLGSSSCKKVSLHRLNSKTNALVLLLKTI